MPVVVVDGETYHRTAEACKIAGVSRNTFLRWVREGLFPDVKYRDRRSWRLFSENDVDRLKAEANKIQAAIPQNRDKSFASTK